MKKIISIAPVIIVIVLLNFEFRTVREFGRNHFGWYCFISFDTGSRTYRDNSSYFDREFRSIFLSSEEIDEIRNQITDILEREDTNDETDLSEDRDFPDPSSDS